MTLALIVACEDSIYAVSDTLGQYIFDSQQAASGQYQCGECYSLNTKKLFYSHKHKIVLCISGDYVLLPSKEAVNGQAWCVDYILDEFIKHIDLVPICKASNLTNALKDFINERFPGSWDAFLENIALFYGSFEDETSTIYQLLKGEQKYLKYHKNPYDKLNTFSNFPEPLTNELQKFLNQYNLDKSTYLTKHDLLCLQEWRGITLFSFIPQLCIALNIECSHLIGPYFEYFCIAKSGQATHYHFYYGLNEEGKLLSYKIPSEDYPAYIISETQGEHRIRLYNDEIPLYSTYDNSQVKVLKTQ